MSALKVNGPKNFILLRAFRLYPVYWVALLATTIITLIYPLNEPIGYVSITRRFVANTTMFQSFAEVASLDSVYWTLQVELSFYIYVCILLHAKRINNIIWYVMILVAISIVDHLIPRPLGAVADYFRKVLMFEYAYLFATGIIFYKTVSENTYKYLPLYLICLICPLIANYPPNNPIQDVGMFILISIVFYCAVNGKLKRLAIKPLLWLGSVSYSLYLTHHLIGLTALKLMDDINVNPDLALFISLSLCLLIAGVINSYIEKPSQAWLRTRWVSNGNLTNFRES